MRPSRITTALTTAALTAVPRWVPAADDVTPSPGVDVSSLLRLTIGLAVVVIAIFAVTWLLRRVGGMTSGVSGQMRLLGGLSVGNRERVVLVQVGDTQLVLGVAPGRVQTLHILDRNVVPESGTDDVAGQGAPFAERLQRIMKQRER